MKPQLNKGYIHTYICMYKYIIYISMYTYMYIYAHNCEFNKWEWMFYYLPTTTMKNGCDTNRKIYENQNNGCSSKNNNDNSMYIVYDERVIRIKNAQDGIINEQNLYTRTYII